MFKLVLCKSLWLYTIACDTLRRYIILPYESRSLYDKNMPLFTNL